jgi:hypothetical protein
MPVEFASLTRVPLATAHQVAALSPASEPAAGAPSRAIDASFLDARQRTQRFTGPDWQPQAASPDFKPFGDDGLTFDDLVDVINPLQQLPVVGSIYRWLTGDTISPAARIAGGALFGGPIGLAGSIGSLIVEGITGGAADQEVLTALLGPSPFADEPPTPMPALANAQPPAGGPEMVVAPAAGTESVDEAFPSAGPATGRPPATGRIELDPAAEAALLNFISRHAPATLGAATDPAAPSVIEINPLPAAGTDLPGSIPLDISRAYDSYRREQGRRDGALAPEIELDIRS